MSRPVHNAAIVLAASLLVGALTGTAASQAGEPLTVTPTQGSQFTAVSVSGSNCRTGSPSVVGALIGPPGTGDQIEGTPFQTAVTGTVFTATPDATGAWTAGFTVPPFIPGGQYEVRALCKADPNATTGQEYQPRPFSVLASTAPTISVSPREGRAGQETRLSVAGTLCQGTDALVQVGVFLRTPESRGQADEFVVRGMFRPDAQGSWTGTLTIPASAAAGTYGVAATCEVAGRALFTYLPIPEVVLAAPSGPPPAVVRFTG